ncbi:MAG TPA: type VII secretion target [Ornithinibacter sp.]|nr:type VII secretion target [Ornithinibacter sp.]
MRDIEVSPGGIRSHASTLSGIEGRVGDAAGAADTTLDASAFGVVNGFLAATAGLLGSALETAIRSEADSLGETVATLRQMAKNHETTDDNASTTIVTAGS